MDQEKETDLISLSSLSLPSSRRWWSEETVAVVTGSNRGIGFAVVKRLLQLGLTVVLTARNAENGRQAAESLRNAGLSNVHFLRLDVSDTSSVNDFVSSFKQKFGTLDILVNNAAVTFNVIHDNKISAGHEETVMKTNFYGPKQLTEALLPLFRRSSSVSRILNISSRLGTLNKLRNPNIRRILEDESLTEENIEMAVVKRFLEEVKTGTWKTGGWPEVWPDYAVSKLALNAYSRVLARRYSSFGLSVNCYCPGFTRTSMTRGEGIHDPDHAADVAARLLLLPPEKLTTGMFYVALPQQKIVSRL